MKECIVVNYTGRSGGGPLDAFEMARSLVAAGQCVIPIISSGVENIKLWQNVNFEKLVVIDTYSDAMTYLKCLFLFPFITRKKIKTALKPYKVKWIYCPMATLLTEPINRAIPNALVAIVDHDPIPHSGSHKLDPIRFFDPYVRAELILVHSKRFVELVKQKFKAKRVEYIPLGRHDLYKFVAGDESVISYDPQKINYVFFGRIEKYKGLDVLAEAYHAVSKEYPERVSLTVIGRGDFSEYEKAYAGLPNFTLVNRWIKDEEVKGVFTGENLVTVCPYKDATQSGVVLVSYDFGIPVIATDSGGVGEQIIDGKTGFLVPPSDAVALGRSMKKYIEKPELIMEQQKHVKEYLDTLEWDEIAKRLLGYLS